MKYNWKTLLVLGILLLVQVGMVAGQVTSVRNAIGCMVCRIFNIIFYIASAVAALVIVVAGVQWVGSGDDAGARASAKNTIIHAIIGLIIVIIAVYLVSWLTSGFSQMASTTSWIRGCTDACAEVGG